MVRGLYRSAILGLTYLLMYSGFVWISEPNERFIKLGARNLIISLMYWFGDWQKKRGQNVGYKGVSPCRKRPFPSLDCWCFVFACCSLTQCSSGISAFSRFPSWVVRFPVLAFSQISRSFRVWPVPVPFSLPRWLVPGIPVKLPNELIICWHFHLFRPYRTHNRPMCQYIIDFLIN